MVDAKNRKRENTDLSFSHLIAFLTSPKQSLVGILLDTRVQESFQYIYAAFRNTVLHSPQMWEGLRDTDARRTKMG